jgi:hypothetical protein
MNKNIRDLNRGIYKFNLVKDEKCDLFAESPQYFE